MDFSNYQSYLLPILLIGFFAFRFYRFKKIKNQIPKYLAEGAIIIDVRSQNEYTLRHNPNSSNIPLDQLNLESKNLDKTKTIILCCASGSRSAMALGILKKNGFQHVINAGPWNNTSV